MKLEIACLPLGPIGTNCYLVADSATKDAVAIDPGWDAPLVIAQAKKLNINLCAVWLTHAHFDHIGGVAGLVNELKIPLALHSKELPLYEQKGGAKLFGIDVGELPAPTIQLEDYINVETRHGASLQMGNIKFEVRFVPGHTQGHVAFYQKDNGVIFSGDVLFQGSIGRTDLPGGDHAQLISSIQRQLLSLPDSTIVYSGHGAPTTVGEERETNPFLS